MMMTIRSNIEMGLQDPAELPGASLFISKNKAVNRRAEGCRQGRYNQTPNQI